MTFEQELENIINKYSLESKSNTPDFILARYVTLCLNSFHIICNQREKWYGRLTDQGPKI